MIAPKYKQIYFLILIFQKIGLCSDIMRNWNEEKHDISMNIIITPNKIYNCLLL